VPRHKRRVRKTPQPESKPLAPSFVLRYAEPEIHETAHKHGVSTLDIQHATTHAIQTFQYFDELDRERILVIGPDRSGNLLELIATIRPDQTARVFHAMKLRPKFQNLISQRKGE
jgi:hypothetical protein